MELPGYSPCLLLMHKLFNSESLTADMMVSEVYQGVLLTCFEGCGFREL